jgi:hypothetical protein
LQGTAAPDLPVIDLSVGPKWELNAGVGLIVKMILGDRFEWGSR